MSVQIRPAVVADALDIASCLATLGYGTSHSAVEEKLAAFAGSGSDEVLVAVCGTSVVGTISLHLIPVFHTLGCMARLTALAVQPHSQRQGVGRALVAAAEAWASASGALRIEVTSGDHRPGAHAFYEALGYHSDERRFLKHVRPKGVAS